MYAISALFNRVAIIHMMLFKFKLIRIKYNEKFCSPWARFQVLSRQCHYWLYIVPCRSRTFQSSQKFCGTGLYQTQESINDSWIGTIRINWSTIFSFCNNTDFSSFWKSDLKFYSWYFLLPLEMDRAGIKVYSSPIELPKYVIMTFMLFIKHEKD